MKDTGSWIIRQINALLIHFIGGFYNSIIVPIIKWFINHSSKTPLLTELVPENFLNAITILSLLLLTVFLSYGIIMSMTGKTLGLQNELTPSQLFVRVGIAILIIMVSITAINEMIELSNKLIKSIQIEDTDFDKVVEKIMQDYVNISKEPGFDRGEPIYDPYGQVIVSYSNDPNPPEPLTAILIQLIVVIIAFIFLLIMIVRFLVFWIKRIALIAVFGAFSPIAAILYILPGTEHYAKLIFKKIVLDIFTIFLVLLAISIGASVVGNEKIVGTIFERSDNQWMNVTFQLVLLIAIFMVALKIPDILDRVGGVDLGAFAAWGVATGYLVNSVRWAKSKKDNSGGSSGEGSGGGRFGGRNSGGDNRGGGPTGGGGGGSSGGIHEINSREYRGSLKNAPQNLFNKWYKNYSYDEGYAPPLFKKRAKSYNISNQDPLKMAEYGKNYPEINRKLKIAHANYKKDRIMEEFEDKLSEEE